MYGAVCYTITTAMNTHTKVETLTRGAVADIIDQKVLEVEHKFDINDVTSCTLILRGAK